MSVDRYHRKMVRFPFPDEPLKPALFSQLFVVWTAIIYMIICIALVLITSSGAALPTTASKSSLDLATWVNETGKPSVIRGPVVEALGLPPADLPVRERGFRGPAEQFTHVCSVSSEPRFEDVMFLALVDESDGSATVWRTTRVGQLTAAVRFVDGKATRIPNQETQTMFVSEKEYFLRQMRVRSFRTRPARAMSPIPPKPVETKTETVVPAAWRNTALPADVTFLLLNPWLFPIAIAAVTIAALQQTRSP